MPTLRGDFAVAVFQRGSAAAKLLRVPLLLSRPCCAVIKPQ
jgi:hypothetical protein